MTEAEVIEVVMRRKTSQGSSRDAEQRRSRPDSCHKGNLKRLKTSSVGGFQRWEKENELLWAMLEDETEWLGKLFPDVVITPDLFFYALEDGVVLCRLANLIQEKAEEFGKKNSVKIPGKTFKFHRTIQKKNKQLALFKSRENVQAFLTWCRQLGISDSILFESNDIVEADECREGCREVVICLMEIARRAAGRFKFTPIPKLIQLEKEIEAEELEDAEKNTLDQIDYDSTDEESTDSGHSPGRDHSSPNDEDEHRHHTGGGKKNTKKHSKSELDKEVFKIVDNFNVYNIRKIKEGKYLILGKIIFVRMLNGHVLLRIGGGWDTLEHYLLTHIPKAPVSENGHSSSEVTPSVSKTPQKPQLSKLLDKVKKATPVSSPYRGPAAGKNLKQDDSSEDDEKDITSAIRKIEFSVNKNIATRRKNSKVIEGTPDKTFSPSFDLTQTDINQNNNIVDEDQTPVRQLKQTQEQLAPCSKSDQSTTKMEDETCRAESGFFEETNANGEPIFGDVEDGVEQFVDHEEKYENGVPNDAVEREIAEEEIQEKTDVVDGAIVDIRTETTPALFPDVKESDVILKDGLADTSLEEGKTVDSAGSPTNDQQLIDQTSYNSDIKEPQRSPPTEPSTESPESTSSSTDHEPISDETPATNIDTITSLQNNVKNDLTKPAADDVGIVDVPAIIPNGDLSVAPKRATLPLDKKVADASMKKAPKNTKEPRKTKTASGKSTVPKTSATKTSAPASATSRLKTSPTKSTTRPTSAATRTTTRPVSAAKPTTKSSIKGTVGDNAPKTGKTSPTPKQPTTRPKTSPTTRPTHPTKTTATAATATKTSLRTSGATAKKPGETAKKPGETTKKPERTTTKPRETTKNAGDTTKKAPSSTRPSTAPPAKSSYLKRKPVASKVESGLGSSRPQTAKTTKTGVKPGATLKSATDGGVASKADDKTSKEAPARAPSPTKPLVRKTHTKTVTTLKTTKKNAVGEPEVKSQTIKTTKTVTEANGKKTTKTTVKEISPTGRKPLKMTTTETTEANGAPAKKTGSTAARARTEKIGTKKTEVKGKTDTKMRPTKPSKTTEACIGPKKTTTKGKSEGKVSGHLKTTMPKNKTVKELSNALGITKPGVGGRTSPEKKPAKPADEKPVEPAKEKPVEPAEIVTVEQFEDKTVVEIEERRDEQIEEKLNELYNEKPVFQGDVITVEQVNVKTVVEPTEEKCVERTEENLVEKAPFKSPEEELVQPMDNKTIEQPEEALVGPADDKPVEQIQERLIELSEEKPVQQVEAKFIENIEEKASVWYEEKEFEHAEERPDELDDGNLVVQVEEKPSEPDEDKRIEQTEEIPVKQVDKGDYEQTKERVSEPYEDKPVEQAEVPVEIGEVQTEEIEDIRVEAVEDVPSDPDEGKPVEQVEEEPLEQVEEKSVEQVEEIPVEQAEGVPAEPVVEIPSEPHGVKTVEQVEEKPDEQAEEMPTEPVEEVPSEPYGEKLVEQVEEIPVEQAEEMPVEQAEEIATEPVEEVPSEPYGEKLVEQVEEKPDEQAEQFEDKTLKLDEEKAEGQAEEDISEKSEAKLSENDQSAVESYGPIDLEVKDVRVQGDNSQTTTTGETVMSESHVTFECSEISQFSERESEFLGGNKDSIENEENFDDSLDDVINVPTGDVFAGVTKIDSTEAWPVVDDKSIEFGSEKTDPEDYIPGEEEALERFPVDPQAYQPFPSVFLGSTVGYEKGIEFSTGDNNNLVEGTSSEKETFGQTTESSLEFQEFQPDFQENRKDENDVVTVDDLLG